jgi:hypothetical protein
MWAATRARARPPRSASSPSETEDQARERIVSLLALRADEAAQLRVHPRAADDERRTSAPTSENGSRLADVEVVGDDVHVQEPKDEQRESDHADEREHNHDEACDSVGARSVAGDAEAARALRAPEAVRRRPSDSDTTPRNGTAHVTRNTATFRLPIGSSYEAAAP